MRQPQRNNHNNRSRGRGRNNNNNNNNNKSSNPMSRNYESNGPDVKIRGNAAHVAEKYSILARDAQSSGDRVMAENYFQHAEHYNRLVAAATLVQEEKRAAETAQRALQESQRAERNAQNVAANTTNTKSDDTTEVDTEKTAPVAETDVEANVEATAETSEVVEQPRANVRSRTQRTRRPRKERKVEVAGEDVAKTAMPKKEVSKNKDANSDESISDDAARLPEGLLGSPASSRETASADE